MQQPTLCRLFRLWLLCVPFAFLASSCVKSVYYRQNVLLRTTGGTGIDTTKLRDVVNRAERNYIIQPNDYLQVQVFTNNGERILDPNGELHFGSPSGQNISSNRTGGGTGGVASTGPAFLVQVDGYIRLPMVDRVKVTGLTLLEADSLLEVRYNEFYKGSFVDTRVTNNRVVVLGTPGGRVIPLENDNVNLLEVLALAGGIDGGAGSSARSGGKANNIRLIRGDLKNPQVQIIDLTTIEGMQRANLQVEPNDIIYIEPIRRPFFEALNDINPILSLVTTLAGVTTTIIYLTLAR
ncbi:polysaccharide biosynthesis/export family protein [Hymenobacter sp. GOD-10R]|uniref:polysaccharide biosynthesis/export family protein n=1 Tax=Hymenobacter sp. GOD-10R TaxID=3093922 RepID=UPI002D76A856|nr:polysaccharide biosynthesis/export family protein [Hymenobacter sp. GOD-10R]WRQ29323.1 polysaccharide biosynthesis/export family protein [Hymenobacter sp. GOD-10R]